MARSDVRKGDISSKTGEQYEQNDVYYHYPTYDENIESRQCSDKL